jgi:hypothetical protein
MRHCLTLLFAFVLVTSAFAQSTNTNNKNAATTPAVKDAQPRMTFDFNAYALAYMKKYNNQGRYNCATNKKIKVKFKLLESGKMDMNSITVVNNPSEWVDEAFKNEVIRFIKEMPGWTPGYIDGKPSPMDMELTVYCKTISGV